MLNHPLSSLPYSLQQIMAWRKPRNGFSVYDMRRLAGGPQDASRQEARVQGSKMQADAGDRHAERPKLVAQSAQHSSVVQFMARIAREPAGDLAAAVVLRRSCVHRFFWSFLMVEGEPSVFATSRRSTQRASADNSSITQPSAPFTAAMARTPVLPRVSM